MPDAGLRLWPHACRRVQPGVAYANPAQPPGCKAHFLSSSHRTVDEEHGKVSGFVLDMVQLRVAAMQPRRLAYFLRRYGFSLLAWLLLLLCCNPAGSARA